MLKLKSDREFYEHLIFSSIAIAIAITLVCFAYYPWVNFLLVLTVAGLGGVGVWEYARLAQTKGVALAKKLMVGVAVMEILAFYTAIAFPILSKFGFSLMVLGFTSFFIVHFRRFKNVLLHIAVEFFGVCYVVIPLSFMIAILYSPSKIMDGRFWLFYLIAVTKITDIGGFLIGKLIGKHPLAPQLSPRKTIEGAIGGFCFAVGLSVLFYFIAQKAGEGARFSLLTAIGLGTIIGILAQIGDLAESVLKRDALVKDSNIIPGVGGVLDMIDSFLVTAAVVYFFL